VNDLRQTLAKSMPDQIWEPGFQVQNGIGNYFLEEIKE
jgi:hypothetical protein